MRPLLDVVPLAALVVLLVTAYGHPRGRTEAAIGLAAAAATLATGTLDLAPDRGDAAPPRAGRRSSWSRSWSSPTSAPAPGVFTAAAALGCATRSGGRPVPLFTGIFLLAAAVTAVLSLDATVVLLTPVVVAAAVGAGTSHWPGAHACLRMANSASLLLPVSNLTNLLAMPHLDLTFAGFALLMAPVLAVGPGRGVRRAAAAVPPRPRRPGGHPPTPPTPAAAPGAARRGRP